ncbi:hypothetical protein FJZ36_07445 [Candidatus Poribacteria bacterium]|nr:hypothetical protein [Candidatus Poribacteria bacterium]
MRRDIAAAIGLLALLIAGAMGAAALPLVGGSRSELVFSHERHVNMDIACADCHAADKSTQAADDLIPREESCMRCHDRTQGCELCHKDVDHVTPIQPRSYGFRFVHTTHLKPDVNPNGCDTCHAALRKSTDANDSFPIGLSQCRSCHQHQDDMSRGDRCGTCHDTLSPRRALPASHTTDWLTQHAGAAARSGSLCDVCHRGTVRADFVQGPHVSESVATANHATSGPVADCADCHRADVWSSSVHDAGYLQTHPTDALRSAVTCESCHARDECQSCHAQAGLTYLGTHPPTFMFDHASEARRNLGACAACHQESQCITCHQTINPHGDGWDDDRLGRNMALCGKCHSSGVPFE